ncbi:hypothetical protein ACFWUQ_03800 [Streptomyces sp. NPDC058662]|uniref:hypothetical protein n=1 Tax=Streptomyces sp. NPDC058662 TaxID=3346583 RepID=UPI0036590A9E
MTSQHDGNEPSASSGEPLREQPAPGEPGRADAGAPADADTGSTAKEKTAALKDHTLARAKQAAAELRDKAGQATEAAKSRTPEPLLTTATHTAAHVRDTASRAGHLAADKTPDAVREKAAQAAHAAGSKWTPLLSAGAALLIFLLVRRMRRSC